MRFGNVNYIYQQIIKMGKQEDIKVIGVYLEEALDMGLEAEVVYYALRYMQEDPTMTPAQAMQLGADEWLNK